MFLRILMIAIFAVVTVVIGILCRRKADGVDGFVLGGRSVGPWMSAFAFGTSYFSAVIFVGYAGQFGWRFGIASTWIGIGNAVLGSLLAWMVLGRRTRVMTQHLGSSTMPDFFEKRFGSSALKIAASGIIFVFLIPYTASLYNGLSRIFGMAFDVDYSVCVAAIAVLTGIYVVCGGYFAAAVNDFVQGIVMLFGIVAVVLAVIRGEGGFSAAFSDLSQVVDPAISSENGMFTALFGPDPAGLLSVVLLTSLGTWGLPQMVHKFYAIKSEKMIKTGTVVSTLFAVVVAGGCYFLGGFGRLFSDRVDLANGFDSIIPTMLEGLPDILIGIVVVLVLSASMSTLSSLVITSSSTLTLDFLKGGVCPKMSEKKQLGVMRAMTVFFIAVSAALALYQYNSGAAFIAQLMGLSWGALAGSFLGPFLWGLYLKKTCKAAVWVSFATGVGFMIGNMLFSVVSPIVAGAFAMLLSLVEVPLISLACGKINDYSQNAFKCFK